MFDSSTKVNGLGRLKETVSLLIYETALFKFNRSSSHILTINEFWNFFLVDMMVFVNVSYKISALKCSSNPKNPSNIGFTRPGKVPKLEASCY